MTFNNKYIADLQEIINLILENRIEGNEGAIKRFQEYLLSIKGIGSFDKKIWKSEWRKEIYDFGELFKERNLFKFIEEVDNLIKTEGNLEILEFIKSEMVFNTLSTIESKNHLLDLVKKYPYNPEFRHTLAHFYAKEELFPEAIEEYKLALKIEPENSIFKENRFKSDWNYVRILIQNSKYEDCKIYITQIVNEKIYENSLWHNEFIGQLNRIEDHITFQNKMQSLEEQFKDKINSALDNERKRIIEILGFFSAIIAFILSTVSIGKDFKFSEAIYFIFGLGIILILFAVTMSLFFSTSNTRILKDYKFWILTISIISLLLFIINISNIVCIIC